ncbi:MAG: hypothetical protein JO053_04045, partial [Acidobacteria bacterium]|nr:hypothetical protein [Acidobacteriota bacterium]
MFKKQKMTDEEFEKEAVNGKIPIKDKRRFNSEGELISEDPEPIAAEPVKPAAELALEAKLKAET